MTFEGNPSAGLSLQGERRSLRDLAYGTLRDAIVRTRIAPGAPITEEKIAADLGVSRPVVREAVQRLQSEGLIERAGNGRMFVRPATVEDARAHYAVRGALEQLTVEEAITRLTPDGVDRLEGALAHMREARDRTGGKTVADGGGEFHAILADIAANPVNAQLMDMIRARMDRYRYLSVATTAVRTEQSVREHEEILDALRAGDVEEAKAAMRRHIAASEESALHALD
ncbi:MAG: FCD domain-containing protein [Streptosporangiales bacterium]|nr:FCD domain-containing protein [Streptosporangiales bacterium]